MPRYWNNLPLALLFLHLGFLVSQLGCSKESPTGGPAATNDANSSTSSGTNSTTSTTNSNPPTVTDGFRLEVPSLRTVLEPGTRKEITITIDRDGNFKAPVALTFKAPEGVKATATKERFESNDKEVMLGLEASADAKPGEASIEVTGTPQTGKDTSVAIPIEVRAAAAPATTPAKPPATR